MNFQSKKKKEMEPFFKVDKGGVLNGARSNLVQNWTSHTLLPSLEERSFHNAMVFDEKARMTCFKRLAVHWWVCLCVVGALCCTTWGTVLKPATAEASLATNCPPKSVPNDGRSGIEVLTVHPSQRREIRRAASGSAPRDKEVGKYLHPKNFRQSCLTLCKPSGLQALVCVCVCLFKCLL